MAIRYVTLNGQTHEISTESLRGLGEWGWDISQDVINNRSVSVSTYGAKGDGTTDDTAAFQAAIDAASLSGIGGTVFVPTPSSFYRLTDGLTITTEKVWLVGIGRSAKLKWDAAFAGTAINVKAPDAAAPGTRIFDNKIQNLHITVQNATSKAIVLRRVEDAVVSDCSINGPYLTGNNYGIYLESGPHADDWAGILRITNNGVFGFKYGLGGSYGTFNNKFTAVVITGNSFVGTLIAGSVGISGGAGGWSIVNNCDIESFVTGILTDSDTSIIANRFEDITSWDIAPTVAWPNAGAVNGVRIVANRHSARAKAFSTDISVGFSPWQNSIAMSDINAPFEVQAGLVKRWEANDVDYLGVNYGGPKTTWATRADVYNTLAEEAGYSGNTPSTTNSFGEAITRPQFNIMSNYVPFKLGTVGPEGRYRLSLYASTAEGAALDGISFLGGSPGYLRRFATGPASAPTTGIWTLGDRYHFTDVSAGGFEGAVCVTSGAFADGSWGATTNYYLGNLVSNDGGKIYQCIAIAPGAGNQFGTSAGSGGPTGTGASITDGQVTWAYVTASAPVFKTFGAISS